MEQNEPRIMTAWVILRTAGRHTLRLAAGLAEDGFEVWTPVVTSKIRKPRWNVARQVTLPLMPSFVFARSEQMADLIALSQKHRKEYRVLDPELKRWVTHLHPDFGLFHYRDRVPLVTDAALEPLRLSERRVVPKDQRRTYEEGEKVRVPTGSFAGMSGVVESSEGKFTIVCFGTGRSVKISTFILQPACDKGATQARQPMAA